MFLFTYLFQVQEFGLQPSYMNDRGTYNFIRQVMALPSGSLQQFTQYVRVTWIENNTWRLSSVCVFMQSVRTNDDIKCWHHGLNRHALSRSQLPLYLLIKLLHQEACLTSLHIWIVSEKKLRRVQRKRYWDQQVKIFKLWEEFSNGEKSARQLLKACSHMNGPTF